jgi:Uma2 family endonuclease
MLAISQQPPRMSIKEYLEWEPQQDLRHEYVNGEAFAAAKAECGCIILTLLAIRLLYQVLGLNLRSRFSMKGLSIFNANLY